VKILTIIGARPQFVKAASVSRSCVKLGVDEHILHTGQHFDKTMSDVFFEQLQLPMPYKNLDINGGTHGQMIGQMLMRIEEELIEKKPDCVLVYGDTNSTLAGALAASTLNIPVAHVEAGLRSFNMKMTEEMNRIIADRLSTLLFCPTDTAVSNLKAEGIVDGVYNVGDVMYDAALYSGNCAELESSILHRLELNKGGFLLATCHRAENTDDSNRLKYILSGLSGLSKSIPVIFPIHPRTRNAIDRFQYEKYLDGVIVIEPVPYLDMVTLEKNSKAIITDSGGIQKEAFFYKIPCFTLRDETEWPETVNSGWNTLITPLRNEMPQTILNNFDYGDEMVDEIYGDGDAAFKLVNITKDFVASR
jgi:UDP-GlcNAc3NAcA epimerase